jgi:hypothetical protein
VPPSGAQEPVAVALREGVRRDAASGFDVAVRSRPIGNPSRPEIRVVMRVFALGRASDCKGRFVSE